MDESVTQYNASDHVLPDGNIKCWIENAVGCRNSIERALKILDIDTWEGKTSWSNSCDDFDEILPGYEIKHEEMGIGRVIQWPIVMMASGVVCEFPQENISWRAPKLDFNIPVQLLDSAEKFIRSLILSKSLPEIPNHFKPVLFEMLNPSLVKECRSVDFSFCQVTCMVIDCKNNIWLGTVDGDLYITQ